MTQRLVVFAPNWLGDAVMALPAIEAVRKAQAPGTVDVAARPAVAPLFGLVEGVVGVVPLGGPDGGLNALRDGRYDAALLLPNSFNAAWLARRAGMAHRWGYAVDCRSWLLTRRVAPPSRVHQAEYYRHLVRSLGFPIEAAAPRLDVPADRREAGAVALAAEGWDRTAALVAMAPGAAFGSAKQWPARLFAGLVDALAIDRVRAVLIGSAGDRAAGRDIMAAVRTSDRPIDLIGRTDLALLSGVLTHCRALVTNDSGAMHFGAALGANVAAVCGPTRMQETHPCGTGRHVVLTHPVWCRPCMLRECPLTHRCMTGISVDAVAAATRPFLTTAAAQ